MRFLRLLLPLSLLAPLAAAQEVLPVTGLPTEDPVVLEILNTEDIQVMEHLAELSEGIGPRLTSSDSLTEACQWAAKRFRAWGLQNVRLEEWGTFPVGYNRRVMEGRMTTPYKRRLVFASEAWTAGTDGMEEGAVLIAPSNTEQLEAARGKFGGAWVLVTNTRPRFDGPEDSEDFRDRLGQFLDEEGILGIVRASRNERVRTGGNYRISTEDIPSRTSVTLPREQWQEMFRLTESGEDVRAGFDIEVEFVPGPIPLYNVIAEIPGETDELVIVGAHIDSWDGARGAQDNGTGTSTTMEAARLLASSGIKPKRTIRFMLWSGEEQGLLGSRAYIEQNPEEMSRISCVLVHDGGTNACSGLYATPGMMPMFEEVFAPIMAHYADHKDENLRFRLREVDRLPRGIGSDHDAYLTATNPAPGFFWDQRGETSYGFIHHTQNDIIEHARADYQDFTTRVVASAAWRFANTEQAVPRTDMFGAPRKRLGFRVSGDGITVESLTPGGKAEAAGIQVGDKVVKIDKTSISSRNDLRAAMRATSESTEVVVLRDLGEIVFLIKR
ncbi:MAG: M20/M25/M40 family metallo-hydrolase [Planctomycetes bacterium]|nr:M20/M25/M40 family metallo-hydrolase [Planctomycetota bacterium]